VVAAWGAGLARATTGNDFIAAGHIAVDVDRLRVDRRAAGLIGNSAGRLSINLERRRCRFSRSSGAILEGVWPQAAVGCFQFGQAVAALAIGDQFAGLARLRVSTEIFVIDAEIKADVAELAVAEVCDEDVAQTRQIHEISPSLKSDFSPLGVASLR
jgi:hypothetical protein